MLLSKRLAAIEALLQPDLCLADVGCDHGYLSIAYAKRTSQMVYACDIASGPLMRAQAHIEAAQATGIKTCLSDGLSALDDTITGVVIAGVGYDVARQILLAGQSRWPMLQQIVIQINSKVEKLRHFLNRSGFIITDECFVREENKDYVIISTHYDGQINRYSALDELIGPLLAVNPTQDYLQALGRRRAALQHIVNQTQHNDVAAQQIQMYDMILNRGGTDQC